MDASLKFKRVHQSFLEMFGSDRWYGSYIISAIGKSPTSQKKGLGTAMIRHSLAEADHAGKSVALAAQEFPTATLFMRS